MIDEMEALEMRQEETVQKYMETAKQILVDAGFSSGKIDIDIKLTDVGIAREIIREAKRG